MTIVVVKTATEEEFFERGRALARLADAGMVTVEDKVLPSYGRMKEVRSAARSFRLEAVLA